MEGGRKSAYFILKRRRQCCNKCVHLRDDNTGNHRCVHPDNISIKENWLKEEKISVNHPMEINRNNDCDCFEEKNVYDLLPQNKNKNNDCNCFSKRIYMEELEKFRQNEKKDVVYW